MNADWPLLSLTLWTPIIGGLTVLFTGDKGDTLGVRRLALVVSIITFLLSLGLYTGFDTTTAEMQFVEKYAWIDAFKIHYHLGVDGISMPLIILTTFTTILVVIAGWEVIQKKVSQYFAAFLIMEGLMIGVFSALDSIFFYVFWEGMLIPMFIIIGIWGGERRVYATIKFFIYTFIGSVLMLVSLIYMYYQGDSFSILDMHVLKLGITEQTLIFLSFLLAFAVKVPMWPVHTWLPDAHVEAPTGGSVILAAIMLKIGGYGFLRFSLPITPDASQALDWLIILMSLVAVVYIGFVALVQRDMKKLVAYSSIAHMGFVTLGIFVVFQIWSNPANASQNGAALAVEGAMIQMISHGFISGALFLMIGVLYDRMHTRQINDYGGVVNTMPITPDASQELDWLIILMSLVAVVYIGFVALVQRDMKKLVAYSSIAHMGFVTLGIFVVFQIWSNPANASQNGAALAVEGAMIQMISHGFISGALFLMIGVLYDRMHTRQINDYGGVVNTMPIFAAFAVFFAMSNAGLPGTSGFVGEFMVIIASFHANFWYALLAATTLILGAAYTLWMVKRVFYGEVANENVRALQDLNSREFVVMATLAVAVLALGLWPAPVVDVMHASVDNLLKHVAISKL